MNSTVLLAVLVAMFSWGLAAIFDKAGLNAAPDMSPISGVVVRQCIALVALCIWALAAGAVEQVRRVSAVAWAYLALSGIAAGGLGQAAYYWAAQRGDISLVGVFCAGYPIVTMLLAWPLLREAITWHKALGTVLVIAGLVVLSW